ncbi:cation-translocating P-type ATPase [Campylobacter upsaliensis]|uniref:Cation-translocating P-type ATPase n=1 Tax=Campylobacter upsaliensis TaxID=28080 RepID=A0A5L4ZHC5_CAMUP|nr:cation-translocating P-type ATPase [Campylobacter upsaliensis]EAH5217905.1 cation-translocating P-type ATPase [Campylobacter upsaliensis]EAH5848725.1 cation-translocating P-type ATPase [Campylobacter upsaliensis]EAH5880145.1 cation-translocating P-type ATPase [Campylobacter upsaliensis]EAH5977898.1 cation-translocating P-type ATPase [Campylobacter upsaliensis]EAH6229095.1 cation-translocating P-type ATPase [Campylobacter upsaliensis]
MEEYRLKIGKMSCVNCANAIENATRKLEGVEDASISYTNMSGVFLLKNDTAKQSVKDKISQLGFSILQDELNIENAKQKELKRLKFKLLFAFILSSVIMAFEMFVFNTFSYNLQLILSFVVIFYCGFDFFFSALKGLRHKNLTMNTLVALGSLSAFLYSLCVYFGLFGEHLYFSGAAMIVSFVLLGKFIEEKTKNKAQIYQNKLQNLETKKARILLENGEIKELSSSFVKTDDILLLSQNEVSPVDGLILEGRAEVDMSFLNGEFMPMLKKAGESIEAGAMIISGNLKLKANKKAMDSTLEQLKDLVFRASLFKSPLMRLIDKISAYFVGFILILALLVFLFYLPNLEKAFLHALAVLLISCPCALGLATPLALALAFEKGARNFILLKNPAALEILSQIKLVLFDKTGTLTQNTLSVFKHNLSEENFLKLAQIQTQSSHPIAKAIAKKSKESTLKGEITHQIGKGLIYKEDENTYLIGNEELVKDTKELEKTREFLNTCDEFAPIRVYFAKNGVCLGGVALQNALKKDAKELINFLNLQHIKSVILSGDNEKSVAKIAKELQIDFHAKMTPKDKLNFLQKEQEQYKILFIGDGLNDAAALQKADLSISFGEASELAKQNTDIILMREDLTLIKLCFHLAKRTKHIIKLNLFWAFSYNLFSIPLAAGAFSFSLSPHFAALMMSLSSLAVVLNSLRLKMDKTF